jgi:hypothetical protein
MLAASVENMVGRLRAVNPQFGESGPHGYSQQDAAEAWQTLMNTLRGAVPTPGGAAPPAPSQSMVDKLFGVRLRVTHTCAYRTAHPIPSRPRCHPHVPPTYTKLFLTHLRVHFLHTRSRTSTWVPTHLQTHTHTHTHIHTHTHSHTHTLTHTRTHTHTHTHTNTHTHTHTHTLSRTNHHRHGQPGRGTHCDRGE